MNRLNLENDSSEKEKTEKAILKRKFLKYDDSEQDNLKNNKSEKETSGK